MFEESDPAVSLLQRACSAARAQACAAAAGLDAIGAFVELRLAQDGGARDDWALDATEAATLEVSAALGVGRELAASRVRYAHALRHQLPRLGARFLAGDVDEGLFRAAVFRTGLIVDDEVMAGVDARLADRAPRWGVLGRSQLAARIDKVVADVDLDAVRRRRDRLAAREVTVGDVDNGLAEITATLYAPDAFAVSARLSALAATVCEADPRSVAQRRADAFRAMAVGADRMGCRCGSPDCPAGGTAASAVVIHVVAEQATVDGGGAAPGAMGGYEGLIPAEVITELAPEAKKRPLIHPQDAAPEPGYTPSRGLADYVRCRDLTCRFPGCDQPAYRCDVDHTIAYGAGGLTAASNLKLLCRAHHLAKTFWGWADEQLPDATVIWTSPAGQRYVSTPGSAVLFPTLCSPTGPLTPAPPDTATPGDRTAMMPRRARTRAQQRAADITAERHHNHQMRTNPPPKHRYDEEWEYDDTFTQEPIPPPF